ncbi:MAG: glycoside hydrolase family 36 protein [Phycisphaerae bacterium]|jgi:hypothetical protein
MDRGVRFSYAQASLDATSQIEIYPGSDDLTAVLADWTFAEPTTSHRQVPGLGDGTVTIETARQGELVLTREIFAPQSIPSMRAVRLILGNESAQPVSLVALAPLVIGGAGLKLGASRAGEWAYLRAPRGKGDQPACILLGSAGPGVWDAAKGEKDSGGVKRSRLEVLPPPRRFVSSELTALRSGQASVVLGVLPVDQQLIQSVLEISEDRQDLALLKVEMLGDGQWVEPAGQLVGQWVLVDFDPDTFAAIDRYTTALKAVHRPVVEKRLVPHRPTVWCSWYYYGEGVTQAEMEANLATLERRPLPVDVLQIDDSWETRWGEWYPNEDWPDLKRVTRRMKKLGYVPGIWTTPALGEQRGRLRHRYPHWLLKLRDGTPARFVMGGNNFILDPTHPEVQEFLETLYHRLADEYGFRYFKVDFLRCVSVPGACYHDRTKNRAQAFRMAVEAIRRGIGPESYLDICGGLFGPSIGLADAQRTGSDVHSFWLEPPPGEEADGYGPFTIKQNTLRFWMNDLWDNDPDALMVRRRSEAYRGEKLSLGLLNDIEAMTSTLNQYLGGGMVCFTENLTEVEDDRLMLLRHCSPSIGSAARPRDCFEGRRFPAIFDTAVQPRAAGLEPWHTVSVINWHSQPRTFRLKLGREILGDFAESAGQFRLSAFQGKWTRVVEAGAEVEIGPIPPHGCEVIRVAAHRAGKAALVRTDGHFSMGGREIVTWRGGKEAIRIVLDWRWPVGLELVVAPPAGKAFAEAGPDGFRTVTIAPGGKKQAVELRYV